MVFVKRATLLQAERKVDILIDDEATRNMAQYGIKAGEILDPENAAAILNSRFPDYTSDQQPAPAPL